MPKALKGKSEFERQQLREAVLLMRYRTTHPDNDSKMYFSYRIIGKALALTIN